jgi:hypothetical protein
MKHVFVTSIALTPELAGTAYRRSTYAEELVGHSKQNMANSMQTLKT